MHILNKTTSSWKTWHWERCISWYGRLEIAILSAVTNLFFSLYYEENGVDHLGHLWGELSCLTRTY
jgi:hypothetical protein